MKIHSHILVPVILLGSIAFATADHGPGTSGGGITTQSAETLANHQWSALLQSEWTEFDIPADSEIVGKDHYDLLDRSFLSTLNVSFGVTENFQISLGFGYYNASGARRISHGEDGHDEAPDHHDEAEETESHHHEAEGGHEEAGEHGEEHGGGHHEEEAEAPASETKLATFDPDGFTDLWLNAKYRLYRGPYGQVALYGGIKLPVGETRVIDSEGDRVEPASTPGTGAWDGMLGTAYTIALSPTVTLDASAQYVLRGEKFDYRLGNRLDAGLCVGWRLAGDKSKYPQVNLFGEAIVRSIEKSKEGGEHDGNTGGTVLFLSPGLRIGFSEHAAFNVSMQFPVVQELNGDQAETDFRLTSGFALTF